MTMDSGYLIDYILTHSSEHTLEELQKYDTITLVLIKVRLEIRLHSELIEQK